MTRKSYFLRVHFYPTTSVADELHEGTAILLLVPDTVARAQQWLEQQIVRCNKTAEEPTVTDTARKQSVGVGTKTQQINDPWEGLLVNYSLDKLNSLLVYVGLLETVKSITLTESTKSAQWVAVAAALEHKKKVKRNRLRLYKAFLATYGDGIGSKRGFATAFNQGNVDACACYDAALSRFFLKARVMCRVETSP